VAKMSKVLARRVGKLTNCVKQQSDRKLKTFHLSNEDFDDEQLYLVPSQYQEDFYLL